MSEKIKSFELQEFMIVYNENYNMDIFGSFIKKGFYFIFSNI